MSTSVVVTNNTSDTPNMPEMPCTLATIRSCPKSIVGAGGIIYDPVSDRVLVVKGSDKWSLPKGHRELHEELYETAIREITEETSLLIPLTRDWRSKRILKCMYFMVLLPGGASYPLHPHDTREIQNLCWCTHRDLLNLRLICNKQLRYLIKKWDQIRTTMLASRDTIQCPIQVVAAPRKE
jgi:8-oxo-dGTP pyrophosphatase MutT (NUDIX family)